MLSGAALGEALAEQGWKKPTVVHFSVSVSEEEEERQGEGGKEREWRVATAWGSSFVWRLVEQQQLVVIGRCGRRRNTLSKQPGR